MASVRDYKAEVVNASKELTARERIAIKDLTTAIKIDDATQVEPITIKVKEWAVIAIHNGKLEEGRQNYNNYVFVSDTGDKFVTGSESLWSSYIEIYDEMLDEGEEYEVKFYRVPSKNYNGKDFLTCAIV